MDNQLTIQPGVKVKFARRTSLYIEGALRVQGSSTNPVYFTSYNDDSVGGDSDNVGSVTPPSSGDWGHVGFEAQSDDSASLIQHLVIRYSGTEDDSGYPYYRRVGAIRLQNASPRIVDSIFKWNYIGVEARSGGSPIIRDSTFELNEQFGVSNDNPAVTVDARNNWWGDVSGPLDTGIGDGSDNPDGKGDAVSDHVSYEPWLMVPPVMEAESSCRFEVSGSDIPSTHSLGFWVGLCNHSGQARAYHVDVQLLRNATVLETKTIDTTLGGGTVSSLWYIRFGQRAAGQYRIVARLTVSGEPVDVRSLDVAVFHPTAARIILDHAQDLHLASHSELSQMASITSMALADELLRVGLDKIQDTIMTQFVNLAAPIQDANGIPYATSDDAVGQVQDVLGRLRLHRQKLATVFRASAAAYGVALPDNFDPLNLDLDFIVDPVVKDRVRQALTGILANYIREALIEPLWITQERAEIDVRYQAFKDYVSARNIVEPAGLASQIQHGTDRVLNVVEGDAVLPLGTFGQTLPYDLTLQEQEHNRRQFHVAEGQVDIVVALMVGAGLVVVLLALVWGPALVFAPVIAQLVHLLITLRAILPLIGTLLAVLMVFSVSIIAPIVTTYHSQTLAAAEALIESRGPASLLSFDAEVIPGGARLTARLANPAQELSRGVIETAVYSVDGRIVNIVWSPAALSSDEQTTLTKELTLPGGSYRAVTTLYDGDEGIASQAVPFSVPVPQVQLDLRLNSARLAPGEPVTGHATLTNRSTIGGAADLTLIIESTDDEHFEAWPISLDPGATREIDYTFVPAVTGPAHLRASLYLGLNRLEQQDVAYVVGRGSAVALNMGFEAVYPPDVALTVPLTLTNVGDEDARAKLEVRALDRLHLDTIAHSTSSTFDVPAGTIVPGQVVVLPKTVPGLYTVQVYLNGAFYGSHDVAVEASDTLFGLVTPATLYPSLGQTVPINVAVRSSDNTLINAPITIAVRSPLGSSELLAPTLIGTGQYRAEYTPMLSGTYELSLLVGGGSYRAVGDESFLVVEQPTPLVTEVGGQLKIEEIQPLTVTVHGPTGLVIPEATVVLSGTEGILSGVTDSAGQVFFQPLPLNANVYVLRVEKMGYASTLTQIAIDAVSTLVGTVTLQGRPAPPHARWVVPLRVSLTRLGESQTAYQFTPITDESGQFTLEGIDSGIYEVRIKHNHTLQNVKVVNMVESSNTADLGVLREGDVNNDNYVTLVDFSLLRRTFGKCAGTDGYDARADLNGDTCVTLLDFSLLRSNFGQAGQN